MNKAWKHLFFDQELKREFRQKFFWVSEVAIKAKLAFEPEIGFAENDGARCHSHTHRNFDFLFFFLGKPEEQQL